MHDLPHLWSAQQGHARNVSGEELEAFGKKAACAWRDGASKTLTAAVVDTVKQAGLSPEQVRRVVEFANTTAYLDDFRKESSIHRVVEWADGPADPGDVLRDLNDGGGGTVHDRGMNDYDAPPAEKKASWSDAEEADLLSLFKTAAPEIAEEDPFRDARDLREKLAGALDRGVSLLSQVEEAYHDLQAEMFHEVKQAALSGVSLGEVVQAWHTLAPDPIFVKAAFEGISGKLVENGVFDSFDALAGSLQKTASPRLVNQEHPLMTTFAGHSVALVKMAELRQGNQEIQTALSELDGFLAKEAGVKDWAKGVWSAVKGKPPPPPPSKGLVPGIFGMFHDASQPVASGAHAVGEFLFGEGSNAAKGMGSVAGGVVKYAPHAVGGALALRGLQHVSNAANSPGMQRLKNLVLGPDQDPYGGYGMQPQY